MQNNNSTSMNDWRYTSAIAMYMFIPTTALAQLPNDNVGKIVLVMLTVTLKLLAMMTQLFLLSTFEGQIGEMNKSHAHIRISINLDFYNGGSDAGKSKMLFSQ